MSKKSAWRTRWRLGFLAFGILVIGLASRGGVALAHGAEVEIEPAQAQPGSNVTIKGTEFEANTTVTISLESASGVTALKTAVVDEDGMFTVSVAIPASMTAGSYTLKASGGDDDATADFLVTGASGATTTTPAAATTVVHERTATEDALIAAGFGVLGLIGLVLVFSSRVSRSQRSLSELTGVLAESGEIAGS